MRQNVSMKASLPLGLTLIGLALILACGGGSSTPAAGSGTISTFAGGAESGTTDAIGQSVRFNNPVNVVIGPNNNLYVADFDNNRIRRIAPDGTSTTVIDQANFVRPFGMAFIGNRLFVQTDGNDTGGVDSMTGTIWEVDIVNNTATVVKADIGRPRGLVALPNGKLGMSNLTRNVIESMDPNTGAVTLLAGSYNGGGFVNGSATNARFNRPYGIDLLNSNTLLVADSGNHVIRSVNLVNGSVTTFAGSGTEGFQGGFFQQARFSKPQSVQVVNEDNVFVGDNGNFVIRHLTIGRVAVFAGIGQPGFMDGPLSQAQFFGMEGFDVDNTGSNFYIADGTGGQDGQPYHRLRRISYDQ